MHRAVVSLPDGLDQQARWLARRALHRGRPAGRATGAPRAAARPGVGSRGRRRAARARARSSARRSTSTGASRPRPRRWPRARRRSTTSSPARCRDGGRRAPAPPIPAARASRSRSRTTSTRPGAGAGAACCGAAARLKGALGAPRRGDARASRPTGLALAPLHRLRGSDPNWSHRRFAALERKRGFRSTCFVLAAHRDPHDGAAPGGLRRAPRAARRPSSTRLGLEVGLHASYTCLADERLLADERAELAGLLGGPIAGNRHHYLRLPWHDGIRALDRLGFVVRHDARLRRAARARAPGSRSRSGPGTRAPGGRCASSSCRSC